jgi:hypothetical protein
MQRLKRSKSKSCHKGPTVVLIKYVKNRQAAKHLGDVAHKFIQDLERQMGVHIFMLVGYKDQEGRMCRTKSVTFQRLTSTSSLNEFPNEFRFETEGSAPAKRFSTIFNKVGQKTWEAWDDHLHEIGEGSSVYITPLMLLHFCYSVQE